MVPQLIKLSGASSGATYRVIEFLVKRPSSSANPVGRSRPWPGVRYLNAGARDYGFQQSNQVVPYLQPRGLPAVLNALRAAKGLRYALTGSLAAQRFAPYVQARVAMIYVDRIDQAVERLELREVDSGTNVLLATGDYGVAFERTQLIDGLCFAAPSQVAVDLLTAAGRGPSEGQALLDWMGSDESAWRR